MPRLIVALTFSAQRLVIVAQATQKATVTVPEETRAERQDVANRERERHLQTRGCKVTATRPDRLVATFRGGEEDTSDTDGNVGINLVGDAGPHIL